MRRSSGRRAFTRRAALAGLLASAGAARAQGVGGEGFAGLGSAADDYAPVVPGHRLVFPRDHAPHPAFRIEWWYVTAALRDASGALCGAQWTLFRNALSPDGGGEGWDSAQLWMGHAAATSATAHVAAERFARGGVGQAGVKPDPFEAWIDDWRLARPDDAPGPGLERLRMTARDQGFAFDLALDAQGPLIMHGDDGFSRKAERGQASYYYSQPFYAAEGRLRIEGVERAVSGHAWLDREWSSQPLDPDQTGWDWFSLTLEDGARVMLYRIRHREGRDSFTGTWIAPDGAARTLGRDEADLAPTGWETVAGRETPVRWRLSIPSEGFEAETRPLNAQAWNALTVAYWEGPVRVEGPRSGVGYLEMTGY
ncbi:lipocalin-like domain-containing protein [Rubrimonas cliftonensis]|uniref:Predicted secreted hydrolase n=1 Tax=Rubrimonas cliftonensis TaxID=89524 RepID=A0A1H4BRP8_9RHOB|nr:lipocalin-like domain-containing protein [Rubrimonas cliftonensis]SEA50784.1 Predicted secreted hydrolase [Rubrimonas cliftonensis]